MQLDRVAEFQPVLQALLQLYQQELVTLAVGLKEVLQQSAQPLSPLQRRGGRAECLLVPIQGIQQRAERAEQCSIQPANFIVGFDLVPGITLAHGVTEQHAPQTKAPGVGLQSVGHAKLAAALLIQPPTHPGAFNPASQGGQVLFAQREAAT